MNQLIFPQMSLLAKYYCYISFSLSVCILYTFSFYLLCKLTEQYTKELQDTEDINGETLDIVQKVPELNVEAIVSKDSVTFSLLDDVNEMVVQDSFPEEINVNVTVEADDGTEGKEDSNQTTTIINIPG